MSKLVCEWSYNPGQGSTEACLDEAGAGPLIGRVYAGAVVWGEPYEGELPCPKLKTLDSKKMSAKNRDKMYEFICDHALDWAVAYVDEKEIDKINIYQARMKAMHLALDKLQKANIEKIIVDGPAFKPYLSMITDEWIAHECVTGGDSKYFGIGAASILCKVEHDRYIKDLCEQYPDLHNFYDLKNNMGYGTAKHLEGLKKYGPSQFHRITYKPCQNMPVIVLEEGVDSSN